MQIVRTEISRATTSTGDAVLRVRFCGEGGDCVTVDMAAVDTEDEKTSLDRARTILVQTASFGLAANEYDARSNGNFDQVDVTAASGESSDVYIFEYRDGEGSRRIPPSRLPSFQAAHDEAIRCAVDLLVDLEPGTDPLTGWLVRVLGANGELLFAVDVEQAEAARQARQ